MGQLSSWLSLGTNEICDRFVGRVKDLHAADLPKIGAWSLSFDGDVKAANCPTRSQLIEFLTFFRQFFLQNEPVSVSTVAASLRQTIKDQDLLDAITQIENFDPFNLAFHIESHGRNFDLRQLTQAFISKYFHSDQIPPEIADDGYSWQAQMFPLCLAFERGMKAVLALHAVILEGSRRGLVSLAGPASPPVPSAGSPLGMCSG
jgi:hypothetical protein